MQPIAVVLPIKEYYYVSNLIPEFSENNYSVPLKKNGQVVALSAVGRVSEKTILNLLNSDLNSRGIYLYLLEQNGQKIRAGSKNAPVMVYFDLRTLAKILNFILGFPGIDSLIKAIESFFGRKELPTMVGKIQIISTETVD